MPQCQCPSATVPQDAACFVKKNLQKTVARSRQHSHGDVPLKQKLLRHHVLVTKTFKMALQKSLLVRKKTANKMTAKKNQHVMK
jgi:hypothetical protein